ncbi:hypothetical protein [Dactylococcopsis salina]|nr:hypothetical protein [Dactylococcopsis salina]
MRITIISDSFAKIFAVSGVAIARVGPTRMYVRPSNRTGGA